MLIWNSQGRANGVWTAFIMIQIELFLLIFLFSCWFSHRCRNLFCEACVQKTAPIARYNITDRVKVCVQCHADLLLENNWLQNHLPLLLHGETFIHTFPLALGSTTVELNLVDDQTALFFQEQTTDGSGKSIRLALQSVEQVTTPSPDSFCLVVGKRTYLFNCCRDNCDGDAQLQSKWVRALKAAIIKGHQRDRDVSFRDIVLKQRAQRQGIINISGSTISDGSKWIGSGNGFRRPSGQLLQKLE